MKKNLKTNKIMKKETLEEVAERLLNLNELDSFRDYHYKQNLYNAFIVGIKYQQETIPELVNIPMMVSMDGKNWKRRNVIALSKGIYVTSNNIKTDADTDKEFRSIDYWTFAKPI